MTRPSHRARFARRAWAAVGLLLLLTAAGLRAQDDPIAATVPKLQAAMKNFTCPPGASAQACATFQKAISSGTPEVAAQFVPMFEDPKLFMHFIIVVFDSSMDRFWIVSTGAARDPQKGLVLHMTTYGEYNKGQMVTGAIANGDIPVADPTVFTSQKDGVTVKYYLSGNLTFSSLETWQGSDGVTRSVSIEVSKEPDDSDPLADETITFATPTQRMVHTGKALRYFSGGHSAF